MMHVDRTLEIPHIERVQIVVFVCDLAVNTL